MASASAFAAPALTGSWTPRRYAATDVPSSRERHVLNRLGTGFSVDALRQLRAAGGAEQWIEQQLAPTELAETATGGAVDSWFPDLANSPEQIWRDNKTGAKQAWLYAKDLANHAMCKRIYSSRSLFESMVELWGDHLHIPAAEFPVFTQRPAYQRVLRTHALGSFADLLEAATLHPAMLMYLDNWKSRKNQPNENHGRELLELHTVGRQAGYSEAMVKDSAVILSGWSVDRETYAGFYDRSAHTTGAVEVLGFTSSNGYDDGRQVTKDYLRYLALHPATASRVCRKIATRFVADKPSQPLMDALIAAYIDSKSEIKAVLRALVAHPDFWDSAGVKVRTPIDDVVATVKALGITALAPTGEGSFVNELVWAVNSTLPMQWPRPDGPPDRAETWATTTRMLNSWRSHWNFAGGYWPDGQVQHLKPVDRMPESGLDFATYLDHLSRIVLGRTSNKRLLKSACIAVDITPGTKITAKHAVNTYKAPRLLAVLLDNPLHMTR